MCVLIHVSLSFPHFIFGERERERESGRIPVCVILFDNHHQYHPYISDLPSLLYFFGHIMHEQ